MKLACYGLAFLMLLSACSGQTTNVVPNTFKSPNAVFQESGIAVGTRAATYAIAGGQFLAIKLAGRDTPMLSIRGKNFEWGHILSDVTKISRYSATASTDIPISSIERRFQDPTLDQSGSRQPLCGSVTPLNRLQPMCSGGSDCDILDGSCVNTNGDCVNTTPCGNTDANTGVGLGRMYFPAVGAHCNVDFSNQYLDCYFDLDGNINGPVDLYVADSFIHTYSYVTEDCDLNRLSFGIAGLSYGQYWDGKTLAVNAKPFASGPFLQQWQYPSDFNRSPNPPLPVPPLVTAHLSANYYQFGVPFNHFKKGYCDASG